MWRCQCDASTWLTLRCWIDTSHCPLSEIILIKVSLKIGINNWSGRIELRFTLGASGSLVLLNSRPLPRSIRLLIALDYWVEEYTAQFKHVSQYKNHDRRCRTTSSTGAVGGVFLVCFRQKTRSRSDSENFRSKRKKKYHPKRALSRLWPIKGRSMKPEGDIFGIYLCAYGSNFVCGKRMHNNSASLLRPLGKHAHRLLHTILVRL
jgi:hypothetical protein